MPALVAWLLQGLVAIAGSMLLQALFALGVGFVTYTGVDASLTFLKAQALAALTGGPAASLVPLLSFLKVGVSINIVFSAIVARTALNGVIAGSRKRLVLK